MKITLVIGEDARHKLRMPHVDAAHVELDAPCPACKAAAPTKLRGKDTWFTDDTYHGRAVTLCCGACVGRIDVKVATIFGIEEDRRVLVHGRARVY